MCYHAPHLAHNASMYLPVLQGSLLTTKSDNLDEGIAKLKRAVELDTSDLQARQFLAEALQKTGDVQGAMAQYK